MKMEKPARSLTEHTARDEDGRCRCTLTWPVRRLPGDPLVAEGAWYERAQTFSTQPERWESWLKEARRGKHA